MGLFTSNPTDVVSFVANQDKFFKDLNTRGNANEQLRVLTTIYDLLRAKKDNDFRQLVDKARQMYQDY